MLPQILYFSSSVLSFAEAIPEELVSILENYLSVHTLFNYSELARITAVFSRVHIQFIPFSECYSQRSSLNAAVWWEIFLARMGYFGVLLIHWINYIEQSMHSGSCARQIYSDWYKQLARRSIFIVLVKEIVTEIDIICFVNHKNIVALVWFYIR
jgi:hypothetical protein